MARQASTVKNLSPSERKLARAIQETVQQGMKSLPSGDQLKQLEVRLRGLETKIDRLLGQRARGAESNGSSPRTAGRVCMVARCSNAHSALGFCNMHYQRWRAGKLKVKPKRVNKTRQSTTRRTARAR